MLCNLCGSSHSELIWDKTRFESNNILKCKSCGLVFLELSRTKEEITNFYKSDYRKVIELPVQNAEEHYEDSVTIQDCETRISWLQRRCRERFWRLEGKNVLEIGSASGRFLATLKAAGCNPTGIELTTDFAEHSRNNGFTVYTDTLENLNLENQFDIIVMFHVLEHMVDIKQSLDAIYKALKPGGVFAGEVPNQDDWRLSIFDSDVVKFFHYDPNHYYYFSPQTLNKYLAESMFRNIDLETVERYNSFVQLKRILGGEYGSKNDAEAILKKDIFSGPSQDLRMISKDSVIARFNEVFESGVNQKLLGNCLRWIVRK